MSTANALATGQPDLLFNWAPSRRRKLSIISFLIASIAIHALCFYAFQVVYPPAAALLPAPGRVSVISPTTEDGRLILRWIEAEDPALASTTQRPPDARAFAPPKVPHVPSFTIRQPALRSVPPYVPDVRAPDAQPPAPVPARRATAAQPAPSTKTAVQFSPDASEVGTLQAPPMQFTRSNKESPQTAEFRVAVARTGDVRYCFLQTSSGDPALDEQARQYLALCRFTRETTAAEIPEIVWTTADVHWGSDIAAPKEAP